MDERDREVSAIGNYIGEHNTNFVSAEILKTANNEQKQEIYCLTEKLKLIKISMADLQVEAKTMSSEKNIAVSKANQTQGGIHKITEEMITRMKKEEAEEQAQQLKLVIPENIRIIDNKFPNNVEISREKDEHKVKLKRVCEEEEIAVAHTKNINRQYDNAQATVSYMEYYQIILQSRIDDLFSDLVVFHESAN